LRTNVGQTLSSVNPAISAIVPQIGLGPRDGKPALFSLQKY